MEQNNQLTDLVDSDEYPDFNPLIDGLLQQEKQEEQEESLAEQPEEEKDTINPEALESFLGMMFSMAEQATSAISGVDFTFDEKGKTDVIQATVPVLNKHGGQLLGVFGSYVEEASLVIAVVVLVFSSKRHITELKIQKVEKEKRDAEAKKARAQAA